MKPQKKKDFTDAHQRLWLLLKRTAKRISFQQKLKDIRIKFDIPDRGYEEKPLDFSSFGYKSFVFPEIWKIKNTTESLERLDDELMKLADEYNLGILKSWPQVFYWIIFYGVYILPDKVGTVVLKDMVEVKKWTNFRKLKENYHFPVAIFISAHASKNDITDFIKTNFDRIKRLQSLYAGKTSPTKNVRRREPLAPTKFILSQEGKTYKEIAGLASKKFERVFTYGDVSKIFNNKKKKER